VFSFVVRSSSAPPSMAIMVGARGCAIAHLSQAVRTGGSVTAGVLASDWVTQVPTIIVSGPRARAALPHVKFATRSLLDFDVDLRRV
jgi:hypothetical protein